MKNIFLVLLTIITFNAGAQIPGTPYAGYEFTNGAVTDVYGGVDLTAEASPVFYIVEDRHGNLNDAAEFNQVTRGYTTESENQFDTSLSFWMRHTADGLENDQRVLQMYGNGYGYRVTLTNSGHLVVNGKAETNIGYDAVDELREETNFADNEWHHFVIITTNGIVDDQFETIQIEVYIDNVKSAEIAHLLPAYAPYNLTRFLNSAAMVIRPTNDYTGMIDDLYFYDSILNEEEITALFNHDTSVTGVNDNDNDIRMAIYPNPSAGAISFKTTEEIAMIELSNISGQEVATYVNVDEIDITHLSNGIYFAKITTVNSNIILKKIIKE